MATSGINTKNYTADYIYRRASDIAGGEPRTGTEAEDARDALNEILMEISNRGHTLSNIKQKSFAVSASVASYTLGTSVLAIYDAVLTRSSVDYAMGRMNRFDYFNVPTKDTEGKPSQFVTEETSDNTTMYLWPRPDQNDTLKYYAAVRPEIITRPTQTLDIHDRYISALIYGLAYKLAFMRRGIPPQYRMELKQEFESELLRASEEDKERVDLVVQIGRPCYT